VEQAPGACSAQVDAGHRAARPISHRKRGTRQSAPHLAILDQRGPAIGAHAVTKRNG
jgi:hypothetical protein